MTKRNKILLISVLAAILLAVGCLSVIFARRNEAIAAELFVEKEISAEYEEGEWIDIPAGTLTVEGKEYAAEAVLYFPNGEATRENGCYLELSGKYVIEYSAEIGGRLYTERKEFVVNAGGTQMSAKIYVDYGNYTENSLPNAVKGEPYAIFSAEAFVRSVRVPVTTEVYYLYGERSEFYVSVENGAFIPERAGEYEIKYYAKNLYGDKTEKVVRVTALDSATPLTVSASSLNAIAGKNTAIAAPAIGKDERTGTVMLTLTANKGDFSEVVYEGRANNASISYVFERTGEWELVWKVSDYSRESTATSDIKVTAPAAEFESSSVNGLEPAFVVGSSYKIPEMMVVSYDENGAKYEAAAVSCILGGGETIEAVDGVITIPETSSKIATIRYTLGDLVKNVTVPLRTVKNENGELTPENTFVLGRGSATRTEDGTSIDISRAKTVKFINKLNGSSVNMNFYVSSFAEGKGVTVTLTDSVNSEQKITIEAAVYASSFSVTIKESGYTKKIDKLKEETLGKEMRISYSAVGNAYCALTVNGKYYDLPSDFTGFDSGLVFAEISSTASAGKILITSVNGQRFGDISKDAVAPSIIMQGSYSSLYKTGEVFKTIKAFGMDVLGGLCSATVTITEEESGNFVKTADGKDVNGLTASEEHEIIINEKGSYLVMYISKDVSGNRAVEVGGIRIYEADIPTLEIGEITQRYALKGDKLVLPEISAKLKSGAEAEVYAIVYDADGRGTYLSLKGSYTFEAAGSYKVVVVAASEEGGSVSEYWYVEVAE